VCYLTTLTLCSVCDKRANEYGSWAEMMLTEDNQVLWGRLVPMPLYPLQFPPRLAWYRTGAFVVRGVSVFCMPRHIKP